MRSVDPDLTAKATIREAALELFARQGPAAVSVRQIAATAGVSPALVLHHFGSKAGLEQAVLDHVIQLVLHPAEDQSFMDAMAEGINSGDFTQANDVMRELLQPESPITDYLRRLLLSDDPAGHELMRQWYDATLTVFRRWSDEGLINAGEDLEVRAAMMLAHDMGELLLHRHISRLVGFEPMGDGLERWTRESHALYGALWVGDGPPTAPTATPPAPTRTEETP